MTVLEGLAPLESAILECRKRNIDTPDRSRPQIRKKPLISQGLKAGAGEEGRTPDLMLGKHTL
jgi:hypothetical protein